MADIVGQDDEHLGDVERLAGAIKLICELRAEELLARAAGAVEDHHRIVDFALRIAMRRAERGVMDPKFGQRLARHKGEVLEDRVGFLRCVGRACEGRRGEEGEKGQKRAELHRYVLPACAGISLNQLWLWTTLAGAGEDASLCLGAGGARLGRLTAQIQLRPQPAPLP